MLEYLDRIDRKILHVLSHDSRQSVSQICRKLRLGNDIVTYRIERLQRDRVINRFSAHVDMFRLGRNLYKTYFKLDAGKEGIRELITYLSKKQRTYWLAEWYGSWDLVYSIWAGHSLDYQTTIDQVYSKFGDIILDTSIVEPVETKMFPQSFGIEKSRAVSEYGKVRAAIELDELEVGILRLLNRNARVSYVELASELGSTASIVKYRLEKLETSGVIIAYQTQLDYANSNVLFFKLLVHLSKHDKIRQKQLFEFCRTHPNITCYVRQIGSWPIEIEVEVDKLDQFHEVVDQVKQEFVGYIRSIETLLLRADHYHRLGEVSL